MCIYINILLLNNNHSFFVGVFFLGDLASDFLGDLVGDIYGSSSLAWIGRFLFADNGDPLCVETCILI